MKKRVGFVLIIFLLTSVLFAAPIRDGASSGKSEEIVLLHTNDYHGAIFPSGGQGGLAEVAAYVKAVKAVFPHVLLVDAGDFNTGSALSNMFNAEPDIRGFNIMGYDAVTFGNHEFDGTMEKLEKQMEAADFAFVSSNISTKDGAFLGGNQYIIKEYGSIRVGIFGITTARTPILANPDASLVFINEIEAARDVVNILRNIEKADIVIGLTHLGINKDAPDHVTSVELASAVPGIDIIVDGHSHTYMSEPMKADNTWIVSANDWGRFVGHGRLIIQNGQLVNFIWAPVSISSNPEVLTMLKPFNDEANVILKEEIGMATGAFDNANNLSRSQETAIGNMISDASIWYLRAVMNQNVDFVFINGGGIRSSLPAGPITREGVMTVLPFNNYLMIASIRGSQVIELFDFIAERTHGTGAFPQVSSEVCFTIDKTQDGGVVKNLTILGEPVDPDRVYRFSTNDYMMGGGDGYSVLKNAYEQYNTSLLLSYVVMEYIKTQGTVNPATDGRLTVLLP
ncbi:MAG: 5'-nucleotidase C-terminal domain-containing protein [Treponema sp.]|jgi:5'-nucleotidase/UDP-sugar diphosphatase|nr:5'-nucleotidase C-terminal domain-containing protein [Treponema sp.]